MIKDCTAVLDIGKTNAKLSLWDDAGNLIERCSRANKTPINKQIPYRALDVEGIDRWLIASLADFSKIGKIGQIVPVGHGAAAALVRDGNLFSAPMDYEDPVSDAERQCYLSQRDPFSATGSPALPAGLNLGMQLHRIEELLGPLPEDLTILPWPQYWAWRLCGVMASEVSSLGCHTDLWHPTEGRFSKLAVRRGWATRMAPLRRAGEPLGKVLPEVSRETGVDRECDVYCGLHDSNAALVAALGQSEIAARDATVLSTGTWFISMRSLAPGEVLTRNELEESRDCLLNVDVHGRAIPSARFMGGREVELIGELNTFDVRSDFDPDTLLQRLPKLVASGASVHPTFVPGVGPFPNAAGGSHLKPDDAAGQRALASLYLALVADVSLDLIGSRDRLLIDGRFAKDVVFVRTLAALRPRQHIFISNAENDIAFGALRLVDYDLSSRCELKPVAPLEIDLRSYADQWRIQAQTVNH